MPADNWTEIALDLELRPVDRERATWEVRVLSASRTVHEEGSPEVREQLADRYRGIVVGTARWRGGESPWDVRERQIPEGARNLVTPSWVASVLQQVVDRSKDPGQPHPATKRIPRWRAFSGEWVGLEIEGDDVSCEDGAERSGERCWKGEMRMVFPPGKAPGVEQRTVGTGTYRVRCSPLVCPWDEFPGLCARKRTEGSARISVPSSGREIDWSNRCEFEVRIEGLALPADTMGAGEEARCVERPAASL